jgi:hypothetical protein
VKLQHDTGQTGDRSGTITPSPAPESVPDPP